MGGWVSGGEGTPLCLSEIIHCYIWSFNYSGHVYCNTAHWYTTMQQHSHADLHVCFQRTTQKPCPNPCTWV